MRRSALFLAVLMLLGGCRLLQKRASFTLTFNVQNDPIQQELIWSALRVMERQAARLQSPLTDKEVSVGSGSTVISVTLKNAKATQALIADITRPFTLRFMRKVSDGKGTVTVKDHGSFEDIGIGEKELFWAESADDGGKGAVHLLFTKESFPAVQKIIGENRGKTIGLFVQGTLVSVLTADTVKKDIVIRGIPSVDIAHDFADRVNLGLHTIIISAS